MKLPTHLSTFVAQAIEATDLHVQQGKVPNSATWVEYRDGVCYFCLAGAIMLQAHAGFYPSSHPLRDAFLALENFRDGKLDYAMECWSNVQPDTPLMKKVGNDYPSLSWKSAAKWRKQRSAIGQRLHLLKGAEQ